MTDVTKLNTTTDLFEQGDFLPSPFEVRDVLTPLVPHFKDFIKLINDISNNQFDTTRYLNLYSLAADDDPELLRFSIEYLTALESNSDSQLPTYTRPQIWALFVYLRGYFQDIYPHTC